MTERASTDKSRGEARAAIGDLAVLPVFFPLAGRQVVIAGASERAVWKAELLHATGALVTVCSDAPCQEMRALAHASARLALVERTWRPEDLDGAAIALIDTLDDGEAACFRAAAKSAGVPVNAIDNPTFCDFQFGAIVNRSPLVIGISTDGAAPVFGQAIRGRLETLLPPTLQAWAQAARTWRARVVPLHLPFHARRRFWELFSLRALGSDPRPPQEADFSAFLGAATSGVGLAGGGATGQVTLVGAGPGDPDLITLKALRALQGADVVLYDNLVAPAIVEMARRESQKIDVGKRGGRPYAGGTLGRAHPTCIPSHTEPAPHRDSATQGGAEAGQAVLRRTGGRRATRNEPHAPDSRNHSPYSILCSSRRSLHPNGKKHFSRLSTPDSRLSTPDSRLPTPGLHSRLAPGPRLPTRP